MYIMDIDCLKWLGFSCQEAENQTPAPLVTVYCLRRQALKPDFLDSDCWLSLSVVFDLGQAS